MRNGTWRIGMLAAALAMLGTMAAHADSLLAIAPLRVILNDNKTNDVLTLTNRAETTKTYKITMQDQVMHEDGNVTQQDDFPYSAKRMLRFMPRLITLGPGERQTLRVMVLPPEGLADGDYHTHLLFDEVQKDMTEESKKAEIDGHALKVAMSTQYSVGLPLVYQHGKVDGALKLTAGRLVIGKGGKLSVEVAVERSGNSEGTGSLKLVEVGKEDDNLSQLRTVHVYREANKVTVNLPLRQTVDKSLQALQGMKLKVQLTSEGQPISEVPVTN